VHQKKYLPLYHVELSFSLPLCQQLTQKWDQIMERIKMFDGVGLNAYAHMNSPSGT
jgi:hypothetical protein